MVVSRTNFELANLILRLTNSKSEIVFKPHPGPEVELRVPAIEKAMTLLGYRPTVSLETGVSQAITWYRENYDAVAGNRVTLVPATSILAPPDYMDAIFKLLTAYAASDGAVSGNMSVLLTGLKNRSDVLRKTATIWSYGD